MWEQVSSGMPGVRAHRLLEVPEPRTIGKCSCGGDIVVSAKAKAVGAVRMPIVGGPLGSYSADAVGVLEEKCCCGKCGRVYDKTIVQRSG